ncbi:MAG: hypothetical protein ACI9MC_002526, partial [Kiritimatiellia bacterium]
DKALAAESQRLRDHLAATVTLLEADTESSLWKVEQRLQVEKVASSSVGS